jgi:hypothetical protein
MGFMTIIPFIGYYILLVVCLLKANPLYGCLLMAIFGAARSFPVLLTPILWGDLGKRWEAQTARAANSDFTNFNSHFMRIRALLLIAVGLFIFINLYRLE